MNLAVHPESVFLIIYSGGYCGEFLAWWLGQHSGCVRTGYYNIGKNRYIGNHYYNYTLTQTGTRDKLFLTGHCARSPSKNGITVPDPAQHINLYATQKYHRFFNYLYMIKSVFYTFRVDKPQSKFNDRPTEWNQFLESLNGREFFTGAEMESWLYSRHQTSIEQWTKTYWQKSMSHTRFNPVSKINYDISNLFFNNNIGQGCADFCQVLNVINCPELETQMSEYHQENLRLVENYSGTTVDEFLELSDSTVESIIVNNTQAALAKAGK